MHKVADIIATFISIPILHVADATANRLRSNGIQKVGLLGTAYTMEQDFYIRRIEDVGIEVFVPNKTLRDRINNIIFSELCVGKVTDQSRQLFLEAINSMQSAGIEAIIEGCTEITLLVEQQHTKMPLFDTTRIHAEEAVAMALTQH